SSVSAPSAAPTSSPLHQASPTINPPSTNASSMSDSLHSALAAGPTAIESPTVLGPATPHIIISRAATPPAAPEASAVSRTSISGATESIVDGTTSPTLPPAPTPANGAVSFTCPHNPTSSPISCDQCGEPVAIDTTTGLAYL